MPAGYRSLWEPSHILADETAITLATTMKALWLPSRTLVPTGSWAPGKILKLNAFGKATTDGTAGNYVFELAYGTGDAPASPVTGATVAGSTGQTAVTWRAEAFMECRSIGTSGIFRMWGEMRPVVALLASTLQPYLMINATPADSTFDSTVGTNAFTIQAQRSGAGVWTMTTTALFAEWLD